MFNSQKFIEDCLAVREQSPLVHNITNYVAMNIAANGLLAIGASPLMSFCPEEMEEIAAISSAIAINIGCLDQQEIKAAKLVAAAAGKFGKPWVLDPVGAGASKIRTETAAELVRDFHPTVVRGNASEIIAVASALGIKAENNNASRGVDSSADSNDAVECAKALATKMNTVVSVSGPVDYVTDGQRLGSISNGSPLMPKVTALGCTATALTGAFIAVEKDAYYAALNTMALMGVAGDIAAEKTGDEGTGTFAVKFIDALSTFDAEASAARVKE